MAFPVPTFDHIKDVQRAHEAATGQRLSLNQTVARIISEHQEAARKGAAVNVAREGRDHDHQETNRVPSLLR
jgi:hypothetical protein